MIWTKPLIHISIFKSHIGRDEQDRMIASSYTSKGWGDRLFCKLAFQILDLDSINWEGEMIPKNSKWNPV